MKSTEKITTSIKRHLDRFIGEQLPDPPRQAKTHLISVIGGDTQIAAVSAAISMGDRFTVEGPGIQPTECAWSGMRTATKVRCNALDERNRYVTSLPCQRSLPPATRLLVQEERYWQARTADLSGLRSPTSMAFREYRNGPTGLPRN